MSDSENVNPASRFTDWSQPGTVRVIRPQQCNTCRHLDRTRPDLMRCDAFPSGIPGVILTDDFDHKNAYPGDGGVRWEPMPT